MLVRPQATLWGDLTELVATFRDKITDNNNAPNYDSSATIGTAPAAGHTRHLVMIGMSLSVNTASVLTSLSVREGIFDSFVPMTLVSNQHVVIDGLGYNAGVGVIAWNAGTSIQTRASFNASQNEYNFALWTLQDLREAGAAKDTAFGSGDDAASTAINIDVPGGGICVAMAHQILTASGWTSFSGTGSSTRENSDDTIAIDVKPEMFVANLTLTADPVDATTDHTLIAASFL